jgi:hypothetical protein
MGIHDGLFYNFNFGTHSGIFLYGQTADYTVCPKEIQEAYVVAFIPFDAAPNAAIILGEIYSKKQYSD